MHTLSLDLETYSSVDLSEAGVYRYTESLDFEVLLIGYSFDGGPVQVHDCTQPGCWPRDLLDALTDPDVVKTAWNAAFERTCLAAALEEEMPPEQWSDTMVMALENGLPGSLAAAGAALGLSEAQLKDPVGKSLISYFCKLCKPTKANNGRTRNLPAHDPDKWRLFIEYNRQDVVTEMAIRERLDPLAFSEQRLWELDQRMNDHGVRVDLPMVREIVRFDEQNRQRLEGEAKNITKLQNPNSLQQLKGWLETQGVPVSTLRKDDLEELLQTDLPADVRRVLEIRKALGKTSVKKYAAMLSATCRDEYLRGILQFYGANRSGRWCLTGDHEVLTPAGWVRLDAWTGGSVMCWEPAADQLSFQKAEPLQFDYDGELVHWESQRIDQLATQDHKMACLDEKTGAWTARKIKDISTKRVIIPFTGRRPRITEPGPNWPLRLLVAAQADGTYTEDGSLRFHFSKKRKVERLIMLLRKNGLVFSRFDSPDGTVTVCIKPRHQPIWIRSFRDKVFGYWVLDENLDAFFDELPYWDGSHTGPNSLQYTSTVKRNSDIVQAAALCAGMSATVTVKHRPPWDDAYVVNIWTNPGKGTRVQTGTKKAEHYRGTVYCAATKTGYFAVRRNGKVWITGNSGRLVQTQNLARNSLPDLDVARELAVSGDFETLETLFGEPSFVFSELIRTAFIPSEGCRFVVSDFSAIEARVIAWLAGEEWVLEAFRGGKDIYCDTAAMMYHVPVEKHGQNAHLRQKGKVAVLACIAEGQPVLTDQGLVPIEKVTTDMRLWDGAEWVKHEGVIFKGEKEVISYGGLEATADHIVWTEVDGKYRQVQFGDAAASGSRLIQSGSGREAIRLAPDHFSGAEVYEGLERVLCTDRVYGLRPAELDTAREYDAGENERLSKLQPASSGPALAGPEVHGSEATLREPGRSKLQKLRRERDPLRIPECDRRLHLHDRGERSAGPETGDRPNRQRRELCPWESQMGNQERTEREQARKPKVRVYDILNAGPRHRFTVSGVLVHNCGYQGGVGAMRAMDSKRTIPDDELQSVVDLWRAANPRIVKMWRSYELAAKTAINDRRTVRLRCGVAYSYEHGNLYAQLPNGRRLCYWGARLEDGPRESIVYMGVNQETKQWGKTETYGGKLVENVVQATARDCLAEALMRVHKLGYRVVMHVHDEMIVDVPKADHEALQRINAAMSDPIAWAPGLPLKGDGYECDFYRKD